MERRGSLQRKLVVLVAASIAIATLVSTGIGLWQQSRSYVDSRRQALVTTAQVFAAAAAQATATRDEAAAFAALRGMGRVPRYPLRANTYGRRPHPRGFRSGRAAGR